jgi:hypothetical protein
MTSRKYTKAQLGILAHELKDVHLTPELVQQVKVSRNHRTMASKPVKKHLKLHRFLYAVLSNIIIPAQK